MSSSEPAGLTVDPDVLDTPEAGALVVRGGAWRIVGYVAGTLVSLLGIALVTRHLGVARFGEFQTVLSLITVVGAVTDVGMATYGIREYSQQKASARDELMSTLLGLRLALTALGVAVALAIGLAAGYDRSLELGVLLAGLGLALMVVQTTLAIPLNAGLRIAAVTAIDTLRQVLTVAGFVALVLLNAGVAAFLAVPVPVGLVLLAITAVLVRGLIPLRPRVHLGAWAGLLKATAAFAAASAAGTIYIYTVMILTSFVAGEEQTGVFAASFRVVVVASAVPGLIVAVALPVLARAARDDRERLRYGMQKLFEVSILLGAASVLGLAFGSSFIIEVIAGPQFADAAAVLRIQAFALPAVFLLATWGFGLLSLHRHRALLISNLLALVLSVVLVSSLASPLGARGSAISMVVCESFVAVAYLVALLRGHPDLSPRLAVVWKTLLAAVPAAAVAIVSGVSSLAQAVIALTVFSVMALLLRAVPAELADLLPSSMRRRIPGLGG
jgi:O-antigen/teichoic acid export membrane protein